MELRVRPPVIVTAPLNREFPTTPRVVDGTTVPIPTKLSLALTVSVPASTFSPPFTIVEVAVSPELPTVRVEEAVNAPLTLSVELNVEDASTKMPAEVLVGVISVPQAATCQEPFCPGAPVPQVVPDTSPLVSTCKHWVEPV